MSQQTPVATGKNETDPNTSSFSTDSLLSTNTTTSTINPLIRGGPRTNEPKDYSAAFSILQSRYGTGGHALPSPKTKPSDKLQVGRASANVAITEGSQSTLVSTPSIPSSSTTASTGTSAPSSSSSTTQPTDKKKVLGGIRSLFKGKGKDKK
ncbi:hypothetical protein P691DRAFT_457060 [Macrolepiota fuliginosa MF-IS2]|uniref:Uncharacterized protein n=1 Tax=Macrolepiota fuliginosa MF-IS2 TaxID=1400762 RepID=A0A9P6C3C7_9AGAR|nr:hypothetical protein P691DRAFT_457060 [Macrolepiota fuliginosa MF-IS2]